MSREGLQLVVQGTQKVVPFTALEAVLGGIVPASGRSALFVDLVIKVASGPPTALRLSGTDPAVPPLFPGKSVPEAWRSFTRNRDRRRVETSP